MASEQWIYNPADYVRPEDQRSAIEDWFGKKLEEVPKEDQCDYLGKLYSQDYDFVKGDLVKNTLGKKLVGVGGSMFRNGSGGVGKADVTFVVDSFDEAIDRTRSAAGSGDGEFGYLIDENGDVRIVYIIGERIVIVGVRILTGVGKSFTFENDCSETACTKAFESSELSEAIPYGTK